MTLSTTGVSLTVTVLTVSGLYHDCCIGGGLRQQTIGLGRNRNGRIVNNTVVHI